MKAKKLYLCAFFCATPACVEAKEFGEKAERSSKDKGALHVSKGKKSELTEDEYKYLKENRPDLKLRLISERVVQPKSEKKEGESKDAEDSTQEDGKSEEAKPKLTKAQKAAAKKAKAKKAKEKNKKK